MSNIVKDAPRFTEEQAVQLAKELFGIQGKAESLPSERDQNFKLSLASGDRFVLKIANAGEALDVLELQNMAMTHVLKKSEALSDGHSFCPRVCLTPGGKAIDSVPGENGSSHFVRLLTYLPGKPLALVKPHDRELLFSLGFFFGKLDRALIDFDHPAAGRDFYWDLARCSDIVSSYLEELSTDDQKKMIRFLLQRYETEILPQLGNLRTSVIHSDGNDYNVLVSPHGRWKNRVTGLIDFGDMVHTHTINELAIVCAYTILGKKDPLAAAAQVVKGYHRVFAIEEKELAALFDLICMRLCTSVCISAHQSRLEPENSYLLISQKPAWVVLERLSQISPVFARAVFRDACGLDPVPQSRGVVDWLSSGKKSFSSVVETSLWAKEPVLVDMSVETPLWGAGLEKDDPDKMTKTIFRLMEDAGTELGLGRYDEARLIYTSSAYKIETDSAAEYRTIHMGVDLFVAPGTAVFAFMDGRVHSFRNNTDPKDYGPTIILSHKTDDGTLFYSLYGHLAGTSLDALEPGMTVKSGEQIGTVGTEVENGGWAPHLHFQFMVDLLGMTGTFPGVTRPSQRWIWKALCPDPGIILETIPVTSVVKARSTDEILKIRENHLGRNLSVSYDEPLKIVRGMGGFLFTETGQPYLDGVNNVCHVGHCHPHVVEAGRDQMGVLNTNTRYLHDYIVNYAQRLLATFPDPLNVCFFVCSGSEANELALRLARNFTGQKDIITVDGAYHGNTQGLIDISPYKHGGPGGIGAPDWVQTVTMPCGYRGPHKGTGKESGAAYAHYVKEAVETIEKKGRGPAAFICESMLGCGGQVLLPTGYLQEAFAHVRAGKGICIADEVQVGFGRAGSHFWAFEAQDVVPDIVTLGKPMGNGHPVAAVVTTPEIAEAFHNGMEYFNTYGGNPVSCAVGMAVLDVIKKEGLQENARKVGAYLLDRLSSLKEKSPLVGDVRGLGLYLGVELVTDHQTLAPAAEEAAYICNRMKEYGFLISTDGPLHNVLKFKPPIVFSRENADALVTALDVVFDDDCLNRERG